MTENEMLDLLTTYVKGTLKLRVPTPDYRKSHYFSEQWHQHGAIRYYQLPRKGLVIATLNTVTGEAAFSVEGLEKP